MFNSACLYMLRIISKWIQTYASRDTPSEIQSVTIMCSVAVWVKFMVAVVTVAAAVVLVAKVLVWAEALINMIAEGLVIVTVNVWVDAIADAEIALEFAVTESHSVDVVLDVFINALADVMIGFLPAVGVDSLAALNVNISAVVMTVLEFTMSTPLEEFRC